MKRLSEVNKLKRAFKKFKKARFGDRDFSGEELAQCKKDFMAQQKPLPHSQSCVSCNPELQPELHQDLLFAEDNPHTS